MDPPSSSIFSTASRSLPVSTALPALDEARALTRDSIGMKPERLRKCAAHRREALLAPSGAL